MKNKFLNLLIGMSLTAILAIGCNNSKNSNYDSKDSTDKRDEMSQGMGTVQSDTMSTDSSHQHGGMQGDTVR